MYSGIGLGFAAALVGCQPQQPKTGPGLEPPRGLNGANVASPAGMAMNPSGDFGNGNSMPGLEAPGGNPMMTGSGGQASTQPNAPGGAAGMGSSAMPGDSASSGSGGMNGGTMGMMDPSTGCTSYPSPLGLHLLVDASLAMVVPTNMWQPLGEALDTWTASDTMANTQLAAQLFAGECSADAYAAISVPIASASEQTAALDAEMNASMHGFGAATAVALGAVSNSAQQWNESAHGNAAIVLISGSEPSACDAMDAATSAAQAASNALALPQPVPTYVLAMRSMPTLDAIAAAGGTGAAHTVDDATSSAALADAMTAIADEARCRVALPGNASALAANHVMLNLVSSGSSTAVPLVDGADACAGNQGWYYDPDTHRFAILCPATCDDVRGGDSVEIVTCG